jgi:glycosyltransferase involved in cell wall biosynthesis
MIQKKSMRSSKVTIGIPTLNRSHFLELAVASALSQSYPNIEVVVSDNASTDDTKVRLAALSDPRVKVLTQPKTLSMVENWNACLMAASGDYFLLLSDDDVLEPDAISTMVAAYEQALDREKVGFVYCRGRFIDQDGRVQRIGQAAPPAEEAECLILSFFQSKRDAWPCSILLRRSDCGDGYSDEFALGTDAAMWIRSVVRHGIALFVDEELVNYRVHHNTTASTPIAIWQRENTLLAKFAIDSLRKKGKDDSLLFRKIENAVEGLNVRIVPGLIRASVGGRKALALKRYLENLPIFFSFYGMRILVKGLIVLYTPAPIAIAIRRFRSGALAQR